MISVIMPCYREPKNFFVQALESILAQTYRDIEIIVVMNGNNPMLDGLLKDYCRKDSRLSFYINENNMGLAYSLNRGVSLAKGEYIARMDSDDISIPNRLEKQLKYLNENNLELLGTYCETIHENGSSFGILDGPVKTEAIYKELITRRDCVWHPTWLFRRDVYDRVGGYANLIYAEDYHFLLKARKIGIKIGVLPECCLKYRVRENSESHGRAMEFYAAEQFLMAHSEDIFNVTPLDLETYLKSKDGQAVMCERRKVLDLWSKFQNTRTGKLRYGVQLLMFPLGRQAVMHKLIRCFGY